MWRPELNYALSLPSKGGRTQRGDGSSLKGAGHRGSQAKAKVSGGGASSRAAVSGLHEIQKEGPG